MAFAKHATLVADTDTSFTVTGRGLLVVWNHDVAANHEVYCMVNAAISALAADDSIPVAPGRPRILGHADGDSTTVVHVRGVAASHVSVEVLDFEAPEWIL